MRLSIPALAGLAALLVLANVLVSRPADADAVQQDPAPAEVPEGLALTGDNIVQQSTVHGVQLTLVDDPTGLQLRLHNPGTKRTKIYVEALATHRTGSLASRMGPMTTAYQPIGNTVTVAPGQTKSWSLNLREANLVPATGQPAVVTQPELITVVPNSDATVLVEPIENFGLSGRFSSWSVDVTATLDEKTATASLQLASL